VIGFCCTTPVPGKHIYAPSVQMHNRGNGKGGGVAAAGLVPEDLGVTRDILDGWYMLHIALLDPSVRGDIEREFITPFFDVAASTRLETAGDWRRVPGLEVEPPDVWRSFVRVKPGVLDAFAEENELRDLDRGEVEDEFVNRTSFLLNERFYASLGEKKAFVLSLGKNIMILKVVGYAEAIVKYYRIEDLRAHVWIAHQRYPTKGRVWHPGGAHPFAGINMALVHNGDFANYHSVTEYLKQRGIAPQFLTDTEVAALLFDLLDRRYHYPLEYIIEAMAPTTELDFDRLPLEKQAVYRAIQATHIHGSPDGPWFFIIARTLPRERRFQLLGITDTAMLRPQVFAFSEGEVQVGVIASEKQAIDATLASLSKDDSRICPVADRYWNARGGSHTDGGAFIFSLGGDRGGNMRLACTDKFGRPVAMPHHAEPCDFSRPLPVPSGADGELRRALRERLESGDGFPAFALLREMVPAEPFDYIRQALALIADLGRDPRHIAAAIEALTLLNDRRYPTGPKKRSHLLHIVRGELNRLFRSLPPLAGGESLPGAHRLMTFASRDTLRPPARNEAVLAVDAGGFPAEGDECDAAFVLDAFMKGWRRFIVFGCLGQRFAGCGLGPDTDEVVIDVHGSSGDYLGSGIDGLAIRVHGNAQDQVGQIVKSGKIVIFGDVGQTFMYGAKGGSVYVLGNAAGRPLINAVGRPRVVINGTCLDFLAESFMAGNPFAGGGFVVLNGIEFDDDGRIAPKPEPYPGGNLFSLASGGAIYIRDPFRSVEDCQLNGGRFARFLDRDWDLIRPYLEENERLFGITVENLLTVEGVRREPTEVYRKVAPVRIEALASGVSEVFLDDRTVETLTMEE
jgi:glutamate synthase domain-containing protein 1/glutamate synthase domain-containing protein 3